MAYLDPECNLYVDLNKANQIMNKHEHNLRFDFDALVQGDAYRIVITKEPINYRGPIGDRPRLSHATKIV